MVKYIVNKRDGSSSSSAVIQTPPKSSNIIIMIQARFKKSRYWIRHVDLQMTKFTCIR